MKKQTKHILKDLVENNAKYGFYLYFPSYDNAQFNPSYEAKALLKAVHNDKEGYEEVVAMYKRWRKKVEAHEKAKEWTLKYETHFADNSIEATYVNKYGEEKTEYVKGAWGDACY